MKKIFYFLFAVTIIALLQSCDKDSNDGINENNSAPALTISGSSDGIIMDISSLPVESQQKLVLASSILNAFSSPLLLINNIPENATTLKSATIGGETYHWTSVIGGETYEYTYTYNRESDRFTFNITFKYSEGTFYYSGYITNDGKSGKLTSSLFNIYAEATLSTLDDGTIIVEATARSDEYSYTTTSYARLNPDLSGEAKLVQDGTLLASVTWGPNYTNIVNEYEHK